MIQLGVITLQICLQHKGKTHRVQTHAVHDGGGTAASTRFDEAKCDQHMETFIKCIKASGETVGLLVLRFHTTAVQVFTSNKRFYNSEQTFPPP